MGNLCGLRLFAQDHRAELARLAYEPAQRLHTALIRLGAYRVPVMSGTTALSTSVASGALRRRATAA
jgi:hypothetical protein